jgi:hypothetical protein
MDELTAWLQATTLSRVIVDSVWVWPLAETIHFVGLALVLGFAGFFDLRLIGCFRGVPMAAARSLMRFALAGFALNLGTGAVFLIGHPEQYVHNVAWWAKVGCLAAAGLNASAFEWGSARRALAAPAGEVPPTSARIIGSVSLAAWLGVLFWGRMLPFIGDAF